MKPRISANTNNGIGSVPVPACASANNNELIKIGTEPYGNPASPILGGCCSAIGDSIGIGTVEGSSRTVPSADGDADSTSVDGVTGAVTRIRQPRRLSSHFSNHPCSNRRNRISSQIGATTTAATNTVANSVGLDSFNSMWINGCPSDSPTMTKSSISTTYTGTNAAN